jgi:hypothetical protein
VKSDIRQLADEQAAQKSTSEATPSRPRKGRRRSAQTPSTSGAVRFFLSKPESNGVPTLDREFDTEPEAIVESLKTGLSYFVISEWKGLADVSRKVPLIRKEAIGNKKHNSD